MIIVSALLMISSLSFAKDEKKTERMPSSSAPKVVSDEAAKIKEKDVKTVTTQVNNSDGNPCLPEGLSYNVELKVKKATWNGIKSKTVYHWETVKEINVSLQGEVMEACGE
jgi:hypothetical protein